MLERPPPNDYAEEIRSSRVTGILSESHGFTRPERVWELVLAVNYCAKAPVEGPQEWGMRFLTAMAGLTLLTSGCDATPPPQRMSEESTPVRPVSPALVPGEVLVKFKDGVSPERIHAILKEQHIDMIDEYRGLGVYRMRVRSGTSVESIMKQLLSLPEVEYAEPNYI